MLSVLCCFAVAQFFAWHDERRQRNALDEELKTLKQEYRSNLDLRDAVITLYSKQPTTETTAPAVETAVGATLQVPIHNGDVLIGNLRRSGSELTGTVYVRIHSGLTGTATVIIRMDGQEASVSIPALTTGRFKDTTQPFVLKLPTESRDIIEVYAVVKVSGNEYSSKPYAFILG